MKLKIDNMETVSKPPIACFG